MGSRLSVSMFFLISFILTNTQLIYAVTLQLFNYISKVIFSPLAGLEMRVTQYFCYVSVILFSLFTNILI